MLLLWYHKFIARSYFCFYFCSVNILKEDWLLICITSYFWFYVVRMKKKSFLNPTTTNLCITGVSKDSLCKQETTSIHARSPSPLISADWFYPWRMCCPGLGTQTAAPLQAAAPHSSGASVALRNIYRPSESVLKLSCPLNIISIFIRKQVLFIGLPKVSEMFLEGLSMLHAAPLALRRTLADG